MKFTKTAITDLFIIEPSVFGDDRGYFFESYSLEKFEENIYFRKDILQGFFKVGNHFENKSL